jgi:TolB protein
MRALAAVCAVVLLGLPARGEFDRAPIIVTPGSEQTYGVAVQRFVDGSVVKDDKRAAALRDAIEQALEYSSVFRRIDEAAFLEPAVTSRLDGPPPVCSNWSQIGADAFIEGGVSDDGRSYSVVFRVWDTARCRELLHRRFSQPASADPGDVARRIADDTVEAFIGRRGVAGTEIAFVSDRGGNKEIYVMNADGTDARAATANGSINNFPAWSPDGNSLIYTSYRHGNRPLLFVSTRGRSTPGRLLARLNGDFRQYRGVFDPSGERLAVVLDDGEGSNIFTVRPDGRRKRQLTNARSIEVSPSWSPDGSRMAFVSDRTGAPQIYVMDADGGNVRRLTYDGSYNTSPAWSPDGQWIAYETRIDAQFDIWLIDPEGTVNLPLVQHPRSDETPRWSPNARKIVFASTRRGLSDLYVIDRDGSNLRRLTRGAGNNTSPDWGPFPQ